MDLVRGFPSDLFRMPHKPDYSLSADPGLPCAAWRDSVYSGLRFHCIAGHHPD